MVHLRELPEQLREALINQELPEFGDTPWINPKPLNECRVALVSTAGLHRREDPPFAPGAGDTRKCWNLNNFIEVAKYFSDHNKIPVFFLGPKEENWLKIIKKKFLIHYFLSGVNLKKIILKVQLLLLR